MNKFKTMIIPILFFGMIASASASVVESQSYSSVGNYSYTVPEGTDFMKAVISGGEGGHTEDGDAQGGDGAKASIRFPVNGGTILELGVGESGEDDYGASGGGGGGSSAIRYASTNSLIVCAGGGGGAGSSDSGGGDGGDGDGQSSDGASLGGTGFFSDCDGGGAGGSTQYFYNPGDSGSMAYYIQNYTEYSTGTNTGDGSIDITSYSNELPVLNGFQLNNSNPSYGDTVRWEANISDPGFDDSVTEVQLEVTQNGTVVFEGNALQEDGLWVTDPVQVNESDVWYNGTVLSATDSNGATAGFGNSTNFYFDNPPPQIESSLLIDDRRNDDRELQFDLDDRSQSDIVSSSGLENVRSFSNNSLVTGVDGTGLDSEVTVSDVAGLVSDPFSVDFEVSDSNLQQNTSFDADLSRQRLRQELNITNHASDTDLNYIQKFNQINGENLTETIVEGVVDPGTSASKIAGWEGDWISGLAETSFSKYESLTYDHSEDTQRLVNRTKLVADNAQPVEFTGVDISSVCSQTSSTNILPGDTVSVTTDCNRPTFEVDMIETELGSDKQDESKPSDLDTQYIEREKNISETGGYSWTDVNISAPSLPGTCENCGQRNLDVDAYSTVSTVYNSTGDWIQEQVHNTTYNSGQVVYGAGINQRFNATQKVFTNNTRDGVRFDIDFSEAVSADRSNCQLVNDTVQTVSAGHTGNQSFVKSCSPGREVEYTPVQRTDLGGKYKHNLTTQVEVFSELTSEQEHWIGIPISRLDNWEDRNPSDTDAYVDGQSSEVRVDQGVVNGTEYVFIVVTGEFGDSSLHTGEHTATLIYTEGRDSSTGGSGSTGGQIGGDPIDEVDGEDFSWDLYNVRSQEQENVGFSIAGVPGREFERRLAVRNTGEQPVTLELECVSQGDACDWVDTSVDRIQLDTEDNTVSYFDVSGRIPTTAKAADTYRFGIQVSDPSFDESNPSTSGSASADFVISISPFFGTVIENIQKLLSWREIEPPEQVPSEASSISYPVAALPLISSIAVYGILGLLQRRYSVEVSNYDEIGKFTVAFLVFLVVTGIA